jgi:hypothetical protein
MAKEVGSWQQAVGSHWRIISKKAEAIAKDIKENEQKINHHGKRADAIVKGMLQHSRGKFRT